MFNTTNKGISRGLLVERISNGIFQIFIALILVDLLLAVKSDNQFNDSNRIVRRQTRIISTKVSADMGKIHTQIKASGLENQKGRARYGVL
ncbi:MAG: hypothetical protein WCA39_07530 [Nitrososphaeraceae archaeon]